ncbi:MULTISPECIES: ATP-binding protein [Agrobacterium tumefaciens complex]|uniref:ATP-binding protein n=1 Tax=Agrobacterium tumefaciens TaxID=358 RepID=UPI000FE2848A|nr:ATP-binding protein [Agrobacterium tumefaciens]QAA99759.1 AAA family ATPase [Agrobacterium tumefaciens]
MEPLTDRITRYLLARIRRLAILDLYECASVVGLLETDFIVAGDETTGTVWRVPEQSLRLLDADPAKVRAEIMRRLGKAPYKTTAIDVLIRDIPGEPPHENVRSAPRGRTDREDRAAGRPKSGPVAASRASEAPSASSEFLARLREQLAPPSVAHVAVALLVARAIGSSVPDLLALSAVLRNPGAFVLIKAPVGRFERRFGLMLEDGLIVPYWTKLEDVHRSSPLSDGYGDRRRGKTRKTIKTLAGTDVPKALERSLSRFLVDVLLERSAPVVLADETKTALPPFVSMTADLVLECRGLDHELMAELLQTCCGIAPKQSLRQMEKMALDLEGLSIDALALAIRPGRGLEPILSILEVLGERARSADKSDEDDDDGRGSGRGSDRSGRPKVKSRFLIKDGDDPPKSVDGIDVVQPEKPAEASGKEGSGSASVDPANPEHSRLRQLRVETLSGYGDARDWALDLKTDLQLWRDGGLAWSEMSTKLLLSGPPGTGKTTYARALCNSLQVPLLVTSVASWLEPGYLGDVLQRMSKAFELARENAPVILFIDEIDNIGSRSAGRREQHDDYWRSLINRLLELLDGTAKTDGVIVVAATNLPEKIDRALLRSGRLEKHVAIPLPDMEALTGILAHHLGADLAGVLASVPSGSPKTIEATRQRHTHVGSDADGIDQSNRGVSRNV